jgi:hypothetical protein
MACHSLVTCPVAIDIWKMLGLWDILETHILIANNIVDLFFNQLQWTKFNEIQKGVLI